MRNLPTAILGLWLAAGLVLLAWLGRHRLAEDGALAGASAAEQRAAAWLRAEEAVRFRAAEELAARWKALDPPPERVLFAPGPLDGNFGPLLQHLAHPVQVVVEPRARRDRAEMLLAASREGADLLVFADRERNWQTVEVPR